MSVSVCNFERLRIVLSLVTHVDFAQLSPQDMFAAAETELTPVLVKSFGHVCVVVGQLAATRAQKEE